MITKKIAEKVLARIRDGESVAKICKGAKRPCSEWQFHDYVSRNEDFSKEYARACIVRASLHESEILDIADKCKEDPFAIAKAKLKIDARKWLMSKMNPKKYGDRILQEHTGADGGPLEVHTFNIPDNGR